MVNIASSSLSPIPDEDEKGIDITEIVQQATKENRARATDQGHNIVIGSVVQYLRQNK